jgi:hypothetical protein
MNLTEQIRMLYGNDKPACGGQNSPGRRSHFHATLYMFYIESLMKYTDWCTNDFHRSRLGQKGYTGYVVGNKRLGIPHLQMNDGPQGFRVDGGDSTTAWPSGLNMAASWDVAAVAAWGRGMATEFAAKGANVQLGPGLCVNRVPNCGRAFEYISGEVRPARSAAAPFAAPLTDASRLDVKVVLTPPCIFH